MDKDNLKRIVSSAEWPDLIEYLRDRFSRIKIDKDKPIEEIGRRSLAKMMVQEELESAINELEVLKRQKSKDNISYK